MEPRPFEPVLRDLLLTGSEPRYLRRALSGSEPQDGEISGQPLWLPPGKIAGAYLSPYLAAWDGRARGGGLLGVKHSLAARPAPKVRRRAVLAPNNSRRFDLLPLEREERG